MSPEFTLDAPSMVKTKSKIIILNTNLSDKDQLPLQLAHEIGHIVNGDMASNPLHFGDQAIDYSMELQANRFAVQKLIPYYLADRDRDHINVNEFMDMFVVPAHLEKMCRDELIKAF
nr:ImmA/IrrE family metallo-endopeptidase [Lactobacillus sp. HBUAS51381]